jgi:hypothetical protein
MQTLLDILRDPVWQFMAVLLAIPSFVISIFQLKLLIARSKAKKQRSGSVVRGQQIEPFAEVFGKIEHSYLPPDRKGYASTYHNEASLINENPDHSIWLKRVVASFLVSVVIFGILITAGILKRPDLPTLVAAPGGRVYSIQASGANVSTWQSNGPIPACNNHLTPTPSATANPTPKATPTPACSVRGNVTPAPTTKP